MECYATPWPLWRDSRILWHIVETSYAFEVSCSLSLPPSFASLSDWRRVFACLQARGTRDLDFSLFFGFKHVFSHCQKLWTNFDMREKQALRSTKYIIDTLHAWIQELQLMFFTFFQGCAKIEERGRQTDLSSALNIFLSEYLNSSSNTK